MYCAMRDETTYIRLALADMLREIGVSHTSASELVNGKKKPSLARAADIEKRLGIPATAWVERVPIKETLEIMKRRCE